MILGLIKTKIMSPLFILGISMFFAACGGSNTSNTSLVKDTSGEINYVRDIWPIFAENCVSCHGPEKEKSSLRVDQRNSLLRGGDIGVPALVPGDPSESYLVFLLENEDADMRMPLGKAPLSIDEIDLIKLWITDGASWPSQMEEQEVSIPGSDLWSIQELKSVSYTHLTLPTILLV